MTSTVLVPTYEGVGDEVIRGIPGIAVRLGRALQSWGRRASAPLDRETTRLEYERRRVADELRREMRLGESLGAGPWFR